MKSEPLDFSVNPVLADFLLKYRITPHTTTGVPPCQLFCNRLPRSKLCLVKPDRDKTVKAQQETVGKCNDDHTKPCSSDKGQKV